MRKPNKAEVKQALELAKGQGGLVRLLAEIVYSEVLKEQPPRDGDAYKLQIHRNECGPEREIYHG